MKTILNLKQKGQLMKLDQANRAPHASRRRCVILLLSALFVPAGLMGQDKLNEDRSEVQKKADAVRASAGVLFKYWRIPWVTDPVEGFRLAKEENRPVFLYVQFGDPLEDC